ncbi:MAG: hypothetical protein AAF517_27235 [Planctomycetota bacterium]
MSSQAKVFDRLPLFDPLEGHIIRSPEEKGNGQWAGAPTVIYDHARESYLLCYRRRAPRPERGFEVNIAESKDGLNFDDIWKVRKDDLNTTSLEKCCIAKGLGGVYRLYYSYVDPEDNRWRIDVCEARSPEEFDVSTGKPLFTAKRVSRFQRTPVEGVKDPNVYQIGGLYYMFLSYVEGYASSEQKQIALHQTADVYNTGLLTAPSAYATSTDGLYFRWRGQCLNVGDEGTWDGYQSRLGSILRHGNLWYGFYDGSQSHKENYEEKFGLAQSSDLRNWDKISESGPIVAVPWQTGSVRYTDALQVGDSIHYYYEVVRPDGSHELRVSVVKSS